MHVEGATAVLRFVPVTKRNILMKGLPRESLLRAIATILCAPGRYTKTLTQLETTIAPNRSEHRYNEARFGPLNSVSMETAACYMASVGVTAEEAERWRPWAAADVDMEIEEQPHGAQTEGLKKVRDMARTIIHGDHSLALKRVNAGIPGHYNPTIGARAARRAQREHAEPNAPIVGPSSETQPPPDHHNPEDDVNHHEPEANVNLNYHDEDTAVSLDYHDDTLIDDEDIHMGPA